MEKEWGWADLGKGLGGFSLFRRGLSLDEGGRKSWALKGHCCPQSDQATMASLMREDNKLIRARGSQLHTIRMLIKSSEVTAQPRTKKLMGGGGPFSFLSLRIRPLSFEVPSSMRPSLTFATLLALLTPGFSLSSKTDLSLDPGY